MKKLSLLFIISFLVIGCANSTSTSSNGYAMNDTAENALSWGGIYEGLLPCADCEGINTTVTLNYDGTFVYKQAYKKDIVTFMPAAITGKFVWDKKRPSIIHLNLPQEQRTFFVGEGYITAYDMDGQPIISDLNYTLNQVVVY